jgi:hypothetical protein
MIDLSDKETVMSEGAWQPIETAPKDGTWILGLNNRLNCAVIIWSEEAFDRDAMVPGWIHPFSSGDLSLFWNGACGSVATHWMPLPRPPVEVLPAGRPWRHEVRK